MSEWTKERTCKHCRNTFTLSMHGHFGAKGLSETLEKDHHDINLDDPDCLINKCPACAGQLSGVDPMGMIEAMKVGEEKKREEAAGISNKAKIGCGCLVLLFAGSLAAWMIVSVLKSINQ